jgi:hypothetical protein
VAGVAVAVTRPTRVSPIRRTADDRFPDRLRFRAVDFCSALRKTHNMPSDLFSRVLIWNQKGLLLARKRRCSCAIATLSPRSGKAIGIEMQGYLFSKPLPAAVFEAKFVAAQAPEPR